MSPSMWIRMSLTARGVPFEELHHPTAYTAQEVARSEHVSGHRVAKVVAALRPTRRSLATGGNDDRLGLWDARKRSGLTFAEAEALLDQLEASGVSQREAVIEAAGGVTVRWRPTWPRLLAD